jgi:hypothetical protein
MMRSTHPIRSEGDLNNALVWLQPGERHTLIVRRYPRETFQIEGRARRDAPGELLRPDVTLAP